MVKFGMPSLFEAGSVEESARLCQSLGLAFVELNANFPFLGAHNLKAAQLRQAAEAYGVFFTVHLDDGLNVADFNPLVAEAYQQTVKQTLALAADAGVQVLNMHLPRGALYTLPDRKVYFAQQYGDVYLDAVKRFRDRCHRWAEGAEVKLCVENSEGFLPVQYQAIELLLESPVFGLTLDVGHDLCAGGEDGGFVRSHADRLEHMHVHDALLPKNDHLPLGEGAVDLPGVLALAEKTDATVVLEVKTEAGLRKSLEWIKKNCGAGA